MSTKKKIVMIIDQKQFDAIKQLADENYRTHPEQIRYMLDTHPEMRKG